MSDHPVVRLTGGVVAYDGRRVLHGVDLTVCTGETLAVLGLVPLHSGEVALFGTPLRRFRQWRRIGYVPQRLGAGSGVPATVDQVVASGRLARRGFARPARAADRTAVTAALGAVGLA